MEIEEGFEGIFGLASKTRGTGCGVKIDGMEILEVEGEGDGLVRRSESGVNKREKHSY